MSQKKMEAYKEAKKNVKSIRKKEKRNRVIGWIVGILCAAALIAGSVFLIYYTNVIKPQKEAAATETTSDDDSGKKAAQEIADFLNNTSTDSVSDNAAPAAENAAGSN